MANIGNIFDEIFKAPAEAALHDLESAAEGAAKTVVTAAQADFAAATAAVAKATASSQAAIDTVVGGAVQAGISALANAVPYIGPLFTGTAGAGISTTAIAVANQLIAELQKVLAAANTAVASAATSVEAKL